MRVGAGPGRQRSRSAVGNRPRLVERIRGHGVAHACAAEVREEEAVTAPEHRLVGDAPCDAQPRRQLAVIGVYQARGNPMSLART